MRPHGRTQDCFGACPALDAGGGDRRSGNLLEFAESATGTFLHTRSSLRASQAFGTLSDRCPSHTAGSPLSPVPGCLRRVRKPPLYLCRYRDLLDSHRFTLTTVPSRQHISRSRRFRPAASMGLCAPQVGRIVAMPRSTLKPSRWLPTEARSAGFLRSIECERVPPIWH